MQLLSIKKYKVGKFFYSFFIFAYLIDPTGLFINLKLPALFLLLVWNFFYHKKISIENLNFVLLIYIFSFISTINMILNDFIYDEELFFSYFKTFLTLFIIIFKTPYKYLKKTFSFVCVIISIITIVFTIISLNISALSFLFDIPPFNKIFIHQQRPILGITFNMVFHISSPLIIILLAQELCAFFRKKNISSFLRIVLFITAMFFSGTRANMLSAVLVIYIVYFLYCFYEKHKMTKVVFFSIIFAFIALLFIFLLLNDKSSKSSDIKEKHIQSTIELFLNNNTSLLLFGNGPSSVFYTKGFKEFTNITELSYLDLFRLFGIFGAIIIIFVYFYPLILIFKKRSWEAYSFGVGYLAYLFIAGTNPLLIVPQGFVAVILAYNFARSII